MCDFMVPFNLPNLKMKVKSFEQQLKRAKAELKVHQEKRKAAAKARKAVVRLQCMGGAFRKSMPRTQLRVPKLFMPRLMDVFPTLKEGPKLKIRKVPMPTIKTTKGRGWSWRVATMKIWLGL